MSIAVFYFCFCCVVLVLPLTILGNIRAQGRGMRLLEGEKREDLHACVIGSPTFSRGIRPNLWVPLGKDVQINEVDTLTMVSSFRISLAVP